MSFDGGCLCGAVRYRINRTHLNAMHCHCSMCQRVHGGAYSTHVVMRPDQLEWLAGRDQLIAYESSTNAYREFCPTCGSQILIHGQTDDGALSVPAGSLDGDPPLTQLGHIFAADALHWARPPDNLPRHLSWPPDFAPKIR